MAVAASVSPSMALDLSVANCPDLLTLPTTLTEDTILLLDVPTVRYGDPTANWISCDEVSLYKYKYVCCTLMGAGLLRSAMASPCAPALAEARGALGTRSECSAANFRALALPPNCTSDNHHKILEGHRSTCARVQVAVRLSCLWLHANRKSTQNPKIPHTSCGPSSAQQHHNSSGHKNLPAHRVVGNFW